jgi:hypothetical protein
MASVLQKSHARLSVTQTAKAQTMTNKRLGLFLDSVVNIKIMFWAMLSMAGRGKPQLSQKHTNFICPTLKLNASDYC